MTDVELLVDPCLLIDVGGGRWVAGAITVEATLAAYCDAAGDALAHGEPLTHTAKGTISKFGHPGSRVWDDLTETTQSRLLVLTASM